MCVISSDGPLDEKNIPNGEICHVELFWKLSTWTADATGQQP